MITLNGSSGVTTPGISNSEGYTGDGLTIAAGAPSGAMTLDASGNVGIGTSSPPAGSRVAISGGALNFTETSARDILWGTSNYVYITGNQGTGVMAFGTGSTKRARIDSSGGFTIGPGSSGGVSGTNVAAFSPDGSLSPVLQFNSNYGGVTKSMLIFKRNGTTTGSITENGTTTAYNTSSDYRLKDNIAPMTGALEKVAALKPVTYKWKADGSDGEGFIAHELAEVVPQCVTGEKDAVDADGNPVYQGIDTSFLVATLTAAIQELKAQVDAQAVEIAALKGQA